MVKNILVKRDCFFFQGEKSNKTISKHKEIESLWTFNIDEKVSDIKELFPSEYATYIVEPS